MEKCRRGIAVGFLEGAIYAVGGLDDTACFKDVERYKCSLLLQQISRKPALSFLFRKTVQNSVQSVTKPRYHSDHVYIENSC